MRTAILACAIAQLAFAQPLRTLGELTAKDAAAKTLTVKPASGEPVTVTIDENTSFLRVPPGETSLTKGTKIKSDDLSVGDRVMVTGSSPAARVIVMTKTDLQKKEAAEHEDWQRRGTAGTVASVDADAKQMIVKRRVLGAESTLTVSATDKTQYRRYAPNSVKFSDAKTSSLGEVKVGDHVRILAAKPAQDGKLDAEIVVSGSFRNIAGTVISTDVTAGEVTIKDLETKKPLVVKVNPEAALRKMAPMMAQMLATRLNNPQGAPGAGPATPGVRPAGTPGPPPGAGLQGAGGGMRGGGDIQQMLERLPPFQISDLKPGDALIINSLAGNEAGRVTAISVLAGVEPLLTAPTAQGDRRLSGAWNMGDINIIP